MNSPIEFDTAMIIFASALPFGIGGLAYIMRNGEDGLIEKRAQLLFCWALIIPFVILAGFVEIWWLAAFFMFITVFGLGLLFPAVVTLLLLALNAMTNQQEQAAQPQSSQPTNLPATLQPPQSKEIAKLGELSTDEKLQKIIEHNRRK